ncbi:MAG: lactate racemase domain-containing protein [Isosphaeraceae bacterium]
MRVSVDFQDDRLELELPDDALVAAWSGPEGMGQEAEGAAFRDALKAPLEFPPLHQMVVSGDRVAIAIDDSSEGVPSRIAVIAEILEECGVAPEEVTVVGMPGVRPDLGRELPERLAFELHDPGDSSNLAYLATTGQGRRVYLNRRLTDADVVIPIGRIGYDPVLGFRGPWSVIFPGLSDRETQAEHRSWLTEEPHARAVPRPRLDEVLEVSWLLGTEFQIGMIPAARGVYRFVVGRTRAVRDQGVAELERLWSFVAPTRAECVVVGIGGTGRESDLADLAEGLVTASRVVQHGGRIVALSRAVGPLGPGLRRLMDAGDVKDASAALRGHDDDPDSVTARQLARVLGWADVYLMSRLERQTVEDLSMIPLDSLDDARRLILRSGSSLTVARAEWTRATAGDE